jgi:putative transposase
MCNTSTMSMTVPAPGGKVATKPRLLTVKTILLTCMRYIALNPVRAAIVGHPAAYPYSSYAANTRGATDLLVTPHSVYRRLGPTPEAPRAAYRDRAWVLGSDQSKARVEKRTARRALPKPRGGDRKSRAYRSRLPTNRV